MFILRSQFGTYVLLFPSCISATHPTFFDLILCQKNRHPVPSWHHGTGSGSAMCRQGRGRSHEANAGGVLRRKLLGDLSPAPWGPLGMGMGGPLETGVSDKMLGSWEAIQKGGEDGDSL